MLFLNPILSFFILRIIFKDKQNYFFNEITKEFLENIWNFWNLREFEIIWGTPRVSLYLPLPNFYFLPLLFVLHFILFSEYCNSNIYWENRTTISWKPKLTYSFYHRNNKNPSGWKMMQKHNYKTWLTALDTNCTDNKPRWCWIIFIGERKINSYEIKKTIKLLVLNWE